MQSVLCKAQESKRKSAQGITKMREDWSRYRNVEWQQLLLFDLPEEEKEKPEPEELPYFAEPKNDNERLFNLQKEYYEGDKNALSKMFLILARIAPKIVNIESKKRRLILTKAYMRDIGEEAVMIFIESVLQKQLVVKTSFIAYLRLQVLRALFYQTKSQKFEKWMSENNISLFGMDEFGLQWAKERFEHELVEERRNREEN